MTDSYAPGAATWWWPPRHASPLVRRLCLLAIIGLMLWLGRVGLGQIWSGGPDFEYFYKCGRWLLEHGSLDRGMDIVHGQVVERGTLDWYLPSVARFMTVLAWLPYELAGVGWLALGLLAVWATLRLIGRHLSGLPPKDWPVTQLVPFLVLMAYWNWEFALVQVNSITLLLVVASFVHWQQGRRLVAGFWLGLATLLKLTPGLLLLWFALKRQGRTVAVALATVVLAGPLADLAALGPAQTGDAYRVWFERALVSGSQRGLILSQTEMDWRNSGLGAVLARLLHPVNYNTHFDNDARIQARYANLPPRTMNLVNVPLPTVANLVTVILAMTLVAAIWLTRRPATHLTAWQLRFEWALFVLLMLWAMPVMRRYHLIWTLPVLSLLAAALHYSGFAGRWVRLTWFCLGLALAAQLSLLWMPLEAGGAILASVIALGVPVVALLRRLEKLPMALPSPLFPRSTLGAPTPWPSGQPVTAHA